MAKKPTGSKQGTPSRNAAGQSGERRDFDSLWKDLTWESKALPEVLDASPLRHHLPAEFAELAHRADFCARLEDESILHVEFESGDDNEMAWRMVNYRRLIRIKLDKQVPLRQIVLYVGDHHSGTSQISLEDGSLSFTCETCHIRDLPAQQFLDSPNFDDNVLALLTKEGSTEAGRKKIKEKFELLQGDERKFGLRKLILAAGLRKMSAVIMKEFSMTKAQLREDPFFRNWLGESKAEGLAEAHVADLSAIFEERGWELSDEIADAVRAADDKLVRKMIRGAMRAVDIDEFTIEFGIESPQIGVLTHR